MKITYLGQSCFLVKYGETNLLFDPMISLNPLASGIDVNDIPADYILISHGHQDHMDDAEAISIRAGATIIASYEISEWFGKKGLKNHGMNIGGKWGFDFGTVKCVAAAHSSVLPDGTYGGNPIGFVVYGEHGCFYFAGDTGLTMDMKLIPQICPPLDFSILPIGDNYTMGYEDAIIATDFVNCPRVIGCHYDTFPPIKIDKTVVNQAFAQANKELTLINIGDHIEL